MTTFYEFQKQFPDDEACLERIMTERYGGTEFDCPKCGVYRIREFNNLSPKRRDDRIFDSSPIQNTAFEVYRVSLNAVRERMRAGQDGIFVQKAGASIKVTRDRRSRLTITPRWNEKTLACDLLVGGKPLSVSQISQKVLGDYHFGQAP